MDEILKKYNQTIVDPNELKKKVRKKLDKYEQSLKESKKPTHDEQEDGWTVVHNKGSRDPTKKFGKTKKKKEKEKLLNFYAFEVKESKLKKHKELLAKFEEDKKRLAQMRAQRKFKI